MEESTLDSDQASEQASTRGSTIVEYVSFRLTTPKKWDEISEIVIGF